MISTQQHFPQLDTIRAIAVISVIIFHWARPIMIGGYIGVDIFFALSGYLITGLLLAEYNKTGTINLRNFYIRRFLRLGPALIFFLAMQPIILLVSQKGGYNELGRLFIAELKVLSYGANWFTIGDNFNLGDLSHTWSLAIEEQFYLLWPIILIFFLRKRIQVAKGIAIAVCLIEVERIIRLYMGVPVDYVYRGTDLRADGILMGAFLAAVSPKRIHTKIGFVISSTFLLWALFFSPLASEFNYYCGHTLYAGATVLVIAGVVQNQSIFWRLSPVVWVGKVSYGLYLWQFVAMRLGNIGALAGIPYLGILYTPLIAICFVFISYELIEKPCLKLKFKFSSSRPS